MQMLIIRVDFRRLRHGGVCEIKDYVCLGHARRRPFGGIEQQNAGLAVAGHLPIEAQRRLGGLVPVIDGPNVAVLGRKTR